MYAPTADNPAVCHRDPPLELVIHSVPPHDKILILGYFDAETGHSRFGFKQIIGNHGFGNVNDNYNRLFKFCS